MSRNLPRAFFALLAFAFLSSGPLRAQAATSGTPAPSAANSTAAAQPTMTLEECIAYALANNFDIKLQAFSTLSAKEALLQSNADYDPSFTVSTRHNYSQSINASSQLDGAAGPTSEGATGNISVAQKIASGANVTLSSTILNSSRTNSRYSTFNPQYSSDLSLSVSQPLLRGFGTAYNKATIQKGKIGVDRANLDYKGRVLDTVRDVENAYVNLVSARESLEVRRFSLQLAQNLYDENVVRKNSGVLTDLDVLTAEVGVANARNSVVLAEQTVRDRADALRNLIGMEQLDTPMIPSALADPPQTLPAVDNSFRLALQNQTDYQSLLASLKQLEIDARTAKSNRLPSLSLDGSGGYNGREGDLSSAWDKVRERGSYSWAVGLTLRMPWGLHAENSRYRTTLNSLNSAKIQIQQRERNMLVQVRSAVGTVATNIESVRISAMSAQLSQKTYDLEKARYDAGLSTARRVLERQGDLESTRLNLLQAKVSLRAALNALQRLEGTSIERYKIDLK